MTYYSWMNLAILFSFFGAFGLGYLFGHRSGYHEGFVDGADSVITRVEKYVDERKNW